MPPLLAAAALSLLLPLPACGLLRLSTRSSRVDAGAIAARYGSVGIVTYVAATSFPQSRGIAYEGFLAAVVAVVETPAISTGLSLARRGEVAGFAARRRRALAHGILADGSIVLLLAGFAIGLRTGAEGARRPEPVVASGFQGLLRFFSRDTGILIARRFTGFSTTKAGLFVFGFVMSLVRAGVPLAFARSRHHRPRRSPGRRSAPGGAGRPARGPRGGDVPTHERKRLEVVVEKRRAPAVLELLDREPGITGWAMLPCLGGRGHTGSRFVRRGPPMRSTRS